MKRWQKWIVVHDWNENKIQYIINNDIKLFYDHFYENQFKMNNLYAYIHNWQHLFFFHLMTDPFQQHAHIPMWHDLKLYKWSKKEAVVFSLLQRTDSYRHVEVKSIVQQDTARYWQERLCTHLKITKLLFVQIFASSVWNLSPSAWFFKDPRQNARS